MSFDFKDSLWQTWEENRRPTLKVANAFPDNQLVKAAPVSPMRPFSKMLLGNCGSGTFFIHGLAGNIW